MEKEKKMSAIMERHYEKTALYSIDQKLKENLYKLADEIVDQYMKKTDIKTVFIQKASGGMKNDVIVIEMKANYKCEPETEKYTFEPIKI